MKTIFKKSSITFLLITLLGMMITGCGSEKADNSQSTEVKAETEVVTERQEVAETTNSIVDRSGNELILPEKMDSIVSMAPSITETLVHLGLADKIVAIDKYSEGIEGLKEGLPVYDIMAPDTESLAALKPDIIFATGMSKAKDNDPFKAITDLGILMTYIPSANSIEGIKEDIVFIGEVTKTTDKAQGIIGDMEKQIADIMAAIGDQKAGKTVYFEIGAAPNMYSFGNNTFLNEIIELLGCQNILADQDSWVAVSEEVVLSKNPDIIFTNVDYVEDTVADITGRNGWDALNAVKEKQVYQVDKNTSSRPNEFVGLAIEEMAKIIYPELF